MVLGEASRIPAKAMATSIHKRPFRQLEHHHCSFYSADCGQSDLLILQPACKLRDLEIQEIIEDVLSANLHGVSYCSWDSEKRCASLSELIKRKLKIRHAGLSNVLVMVFIGKINDTGLEKASHRVWKPNYNSFASAWYKNSSLFAVGTVFATYDEFVGTFAE